MTVSVRLHGREACEAASVTICFADVARPFKNLQAVVLLNQVQGSGIIMAAGHRPTCKVPSPRFTPPCTQFVSYREVFALGQSVFRLARRDREPWTHW